MKKLIVLAAFAPLVSGCESMGARIDQSRQDRCQIANWPQVGERDGVEIGRSMHERYASICGDMFQPGPYQEGFRKGVARRPTPPV